MLDKFFAALLAIPLSKTANIVNWVCFTPVILAGFLGWLTDNTDVIFHPIPLLALAFLGFAYALLLSMDSRNELFRDKPMLDGVPRWLWRWICAGWGALMLAILFLLYIHPI
jgi:hypothetical protein